MDGFVIAEFQGEFMGINMFKIWIWEWRWKCFNYTNYDTGTEGWRVSEMEQKLSLEHRTQDWEIAIVS